MARVMLRRGDVVRIRDEQWIVDRLASWGEASVIDAQGCDGANRGIRGRFLLPFEPIDRLPPGDAVAVVKPQRWRRLARQAIAQAVPSWEALRSLAAARIDLLPFQLEPALALVRGIATRVLIADEVGLGKTVQAGVIAAETLQRIPSARVLVVTPAPLRDQWLQELRTRFDLQARVIDSSTVGHSATANANPWVVHPLVITSIDYVKRPEVLRALEGTIWDLVVCDEAHRLGGRSERHAASALLGERARTLVLLTATPHSGDEQAFARLCGIGDLEQGFPLLVFRRTRADAGLPSGRRTIALRIVPTPAELTVHAALLRYTRRVWTESTDHSGAARLAMMVLMRRACSSAASLARSIERRLGMLPTSGSAGVQLSLPLAGIRSDDEEPAAELGAPGFRDIDDERDTLQRLLALARRAETAESKVHALRRLLRRSREPAIVFTEYRDTLEAVAPALPHRVGRLHGGLTPSERDDVLRQFAGGEVNVLLATDAASEGLNLQQRCRLVINLELPWSPARLEQRVGRVDRIGQQRQVHEVHFVAANSPEDTLVAPLLRRRGDLARDVLDRLRSPAVQERDVAEHVFAPERLSTEEQPVVDVPRGLVVVDLRAEAHAEATRAASVRALMARPTEAAAPNRPFAAARRRHVAQGCWVFRMEFAAEGDELVLETLVGVAFEAAAFLRTSGDVRQHATGSLDALIPFARAREEALAGRLFSDLAALTNLAVARERAIAAAVQDRQCRMAALVAQPGLFDRRAERDRAAQRAALDDVLARCDGHLSWLLRRGRPLTAHVVPSLGLFTG